MLSALDLHADLASVPTGTPTGFPFPQFPGDRWAEFLAPVTDGFMTELNSALEKEFFDVPVAECKTVLEPDGVLDDAFRETMAVRLWVGRHGIPAYPKLT